MSEEQGFLKQLAAEPGDDVTRLVYADWLEERGDARGAFLRAEMALAALSEADADFAQSEEELLESMKSLDPLWLEAAGKRWDVWLTGYSPHLKINLIKVLRELTGCGLADGKNRVEALPAPMIISASRPRAESIRTRFVTIPLPTWGPSLEPSIVASWTFAETFELVVLGHKPRKKTALVGALCEPHFYFSEARIRELLDSGQPFTLHSYPTEQMAKDAAAPLDAVGRVEVRRIAHEPRPLSPYAPAIPSLAGQVGSWQVRVVSYPLARKIALIKFLRELNGLGLAEAKAQSEQPHPFIAFHSNDPASVESVAARLREVGAVVDIVQT